MSRHVVSGCPIGHRSPDVENPTTDNVAGGAKPKYWTTRVFLKPEPYDPICLHLRSQPDLYTRWDEESRMAGEAKSCIPRFAAIVGTMDDDARNVPQLEASPSSPSTSHGNDIDSNRVRSSQPEPGRP